MTQLIYVSSASYAMEEEDVNALLEVARGNNERNGLTGTLVYGDGNFLQVLEGESQVVYETFRRIVKDTRHGGILVLSEREIEKREFGEWITGFHGGTAEGTMAWKLVESFRRQQMRGHALCGD